MRTGATMTTNEELQQKLAALADPDLMLAKRELAVFAGLDPAQVQALQPVWYRLEQGRRQECVQFMHTLMEDNVDLDFRPFLLACLNDPDEQVRAVAVDGLWEDDSPSMLETLLALLDDPAGSVRTAAAIGLSRFAYRASLDELPATTAQRIYQRLYAVVQDQRQPLDVRRRALEALGYLPDQPGVLELIDAGYRSDEQALRESALVAMGRTVREDYLPVLKLELQSPSPAMRYEAARAAGEMADTAESLLPHLLPMTDDDDLEISLAAIWALGEIGGERARATLQRLSRSAEGERQDAAAEALAALDLTDT